MNEANIIGTMLKFIGTAMQFHRKSGMRLLLVGHVWVLASLAEWHRRSGSRAEAVSRTARDAILQAR